MEPRGDRREVVTADRYDRMVRLARAIFTVPNVALTLLDDDAPHTVAAAGEGRWAAAATEPVWRYAIDHDGILEIEDLRRHALWAPPASADEPPLRFYAGVPVRSASGGIVGVLAIFDVVPRTLRRDERELLADLGAVLERELSAQEEMAMAGRVQHLLLPSEPPALSRLEVAGGVVPARDAGGDFFDWHADRDPDGSERLTVLLADVMGKGLAASLVASEMRAVLRTHSRYVGVAEAVRRSAETTAGDLASIGRFVTLWAGTIGAAGEIEYVDAGHGLAVIASPRGPRPLTQRQLPLGIPVPSTWESARDVLAPDELLVVVSDGVFDVLGSVAAAHDAVQALLLPGLRCAEAVDMIVAHASRLGTDDDVAAVVVRRTDAGP